MMNQLKKKEIQRKTGLPKNFESVSARVSSGFSGAQAMTASGIEELQ